jgi:hypothetical protein
MIQSLNMEDRMEEWFSAILSMRACAALREFVNDKFVLECETILGHDDQERHRVVLHSGGTEPYATNHKESEGDARFGQISTRMNAINSAVKDNHFAR